MVESRKRVRKSCGNYPKYDAARRLNDKRSIDEKWIVAPWVLDDVHSDPEVGQHLKTREEDSNQSHEPKRLRR
jgi:hypothetical protein